MVTFAQAISQYVTEYRQRHPATSNSWYSVRAALDGFAKHSGVVRLSQLSPVAANTFLAARPSRNTRVFLRNFLLWANRTYGQTLYVPPQRVSRNRNRIAPNLLIAQTKIARFRENARYVAEQLRLPHQRLVFLLGYLYSIGLEKQMTLTMVDLVAMQPVRTDYYKVLSETRDRSVMTGAALTQWLGTSHQRAGRVWRAWVGKSIPFQHIVLAGAADLMDRGGKPRVGRGFQDLYWNSRPRLNEDLIREMWWPWG